MIKKLLLTLSFIALATIAFSGTTYAAQEGETIVITEELTKLINLYKEGVITEEEFSKAKSILLDPDSDLSKEQKKKKKAVILKKKKLTAAERKREKEAEEEGLTKRTCKDNSEVKCPSTVLRTLKKLNIFKKN